MQLMKLPRLSPAVIAGILSFASALPVLGIWFIYLFVAMPDHLTLTQAVYGQLKYTFSEENPIRMHFAWLAALPVLCGLLGSAYLINRARSRMISTFLLICTVVLGVFTYPVASWEIAFFVVLPALWGWRCCRNVQQIVPTDVNRLG
jgi:hypothetical protein